MKFVWLLLGFMGLLGGPCLQGVNESPECTEAFIDKFCNTNQSCRDTFKPQCPKVSCQKWCYCIKNENHIPPPKHVFFKVLFSDLLM